MRLTRLRAELRAQRYGIAIGTVALLVAVGAPAQALEGATSAVNSVAKALRIAKKADRRSKAALRLAQEVSKAPGPRGPQGPAGSDAQFNGAAAGGGLAGAYPNPTIAQNAIGTAQVTNDALSGSDIIEGSLGQVPSALAATNAQNIADKSVTASSFGTITKRSDTVSSPAGEPAENGNYDTNFNEVLCFNDEMAVAGGVDWAGGRNRRPGAVDKRVLLAVRRDDWPTIGAPRHGRQRHGNRHDCDGGSRLPGAVSRFCPAKASARQATWRSGYSDDSRTLSSSPESLPLSATHE